MESEISIPLGSRIVTFTKYQLKRYIVFNAITMPISTLITLPYNYFILDYTVRQLKVWFMTGIFFSAVASFVMTWVSIKATHFVDKHVQKD